MKSSPNFHHFLRKFRSPRYQDRLQRHLSIPYIPITNTKNSLWYAEGVQNIVKFCTWHSPSFSGWAFAKPSNFEQSSKTSSDRLSPCVAKSERNNCNADSSISGTAWDLHWSSNLPNASFMLVNKLFASYGTVCLWEKEVDILQHDAWNDKNESPIKPGKILKSGFFSQSQSMWNSIHCVPWVLVPINEFYRNSRFTSEPWLPFSTNFISAYWDPKHFK